MVCGFEPGIDVIALEPREGSNDSCSKILTSISEYKQRLCQMLSERSQSRPVASPKFQLSEASHSALFGILEDVRRDYDVEEVYKIYYRAVLGCYEMKRCAFDNRVSSWLCGHGADPDWMLPSERCLLHGVISENECLADSIYKLAPTTDLWCSRETALHFAAWRIKCVRSLKNFKTLVDYGYSIHLKDYLGVAGEESLSIINQTTDLLEEALDYVTPERLKSVYNERKSVILLRAKQYDLPTDLGELLVSFALVRQWEPLAHSRELPANPGYPTHITMDDPPLNI